MTTISIFCGGWIVFALISCVKRDMKKRRIRAIVSSYNVGTLSNVTYEDLMDEINSL